MVTEVIMGNHAVSHAVRLSRAQVIAAYPITPQTEIVEELAKMCADERLKAKFIKVESEHSAMACLIGAAQAGARTFTATASQGLALMHELLFWASYARLPIVLTNVNRALAPGWNIWTDQTDSLAQRDTGWIQIYCETNQEVLDTVITAFRLAEQIMLPVMVVYDAFILSHTYEPVEILDQKDVDQFLPPFQSKSKLDVKTPLTFGALTGPEYYMEFRYNMEEAHKNAAAVYRMIAKDFNKKFKRPYDIFEFYRAEDAQILLAASGSMVSTARVVVDSLRENGERVGLVKMRLFRPFPAGEIMDAIGNMQFVRKIAVLDRDISHGAGGIWAAELRSAYSNHPDPPQIVSFLIGLGGRDVTPDSIAEVYAITKKQTKYVRKPFWIGLKKC